MKHTIIISALGTPGDVYPYIGVGHELVTQGHQVYFLTSENFRDAIEPWGIQVIPVLSKQDYEVTISNKNLYHSYLNPNVFSKGFILPTCNITYDVIKKIHETSNQKTIIIGHSMAIPAKIVSEALKIPFFQTALNAASLCSTIDPGRQPGLFDLYRSPIFRFLRMKWVLTIGDIIASRTVGLATFNKFRRKLDLPKLSRLFTKWAYTAENVIAFFPSWFYGHPPDWPSNLKLFNFVFFNPIAKDFITDDLKEFLSTEKKVILFTASSVSVDANNYFKEAIKVCQYLNCKGVFVSTDNAQIPSSLPDSIIHLNYIPHNQILPYISAIVHPGGIGLTAKALANAVPQLIFPQFGDQFENSRRLCEFKVAVELPQGKINYTKHDEKTIYPTKFGFSQATVRKTCKIHGKCKRRKTYCRLCC